MPVERLDLYILVGGLASNVGIAFYGGGFVAQEKSE